MSKFRKKSKPKKTPKVATSNTGDLWILGDHQLLCGDSTKLEDVRRVMAGDKAELVATDPPYLIDPRRSGGLIQTEEFRESNIKDVDGFFRAMFTNILDVLEYKAAIYCWHSHKRLGNIQLVWKDLGIIDHQQIIWIRPTQIFGFCYWYFRHETCLMGWKKGNKPDHNHEHKHSTVWEVDWDNKARISTGRLMSKPVGLFTHPIIRHTKPGSVVFEPFSGSGSQIIAAERTKRICRAIEIDPFLVDVAIERWQKETGQEAILDSDKKTFSEITNNKEEEDLFS